MKRTALVVMAAALAMGTVAFGPTADAQQSNKKWFEKVTDGTWQGGKGKAAQSDDDRPAKKKHKKRRQNGD